MIVKQKFIPTLKSVAFAATALFSLVRCSDDSIVPSSSTAPAVAEMASASAPVAVSSFTVSGVNTVYKTANDCSTCTYIVAENAKVVNGKELGLKPGDVICLNSRYNYGDIELVNIEGTVEHPIVITTVGNYEKNPEGSEDATSVTDAY